jgi:molecular chaperone GrpE
MFKKKMNPDDNLEKKDIIDELETVNEARVNTKDGAPASDSEENEEVSPERNFEAELEEANDKYVRLYAEFDNYKRRTSKERIDMLQSAGKEVISSLLPVIDDFERALKSMEATDNVESVKEGILLVSQKLQSILQQKGLKAMESINQPFDVEIHEAVTNIPAPSEEMKGKVIDEVEKGYYLNGKVLRYAKVIVGS